MFVIPSDWRLDTFTVSAEEKLPKFRLKGFADTDKSSTSKKAGLLVTFDDEGIESGKYVTKFMSTLYLHRKKDRFTPEQEIVRMPGQTSPTRLTPSSTVRVTEESVYLPQRIDTLAICSTCQACNCIIIDIGYIIYSPSD